jgi:hypothetical protein
VRVEFGFSSPFIVVVAPSRATITMGTYGIRPPMQLLRKLVCEDLQVLLEKKLPF